MCVTVCVAVTTLEQVAWRVDFVLSSQLLDAVNAACVQLKVTVKDPTRDGAPSQTTRFVASADTLHTLISGTRRRAHVITLFLRSQCCFRSFGPAQSSKRPRP